MAGAGDGIDMCAVCHDAFTDPKFLPCHHTFCATCITDLASNQRGDAFLCPICRARTSLPPGGVSALQTNFYIQDRGPQHPCGVHKKKELEMFCLECQKPICVQCILTNHAQHTAQDIDLAVQEKKNELIKDTRRLNKDLGYDRNQLRKTKSLNIVVWTKIAGIEKGIRDRHTSLVAAADKSRDEALASLGIASKRFKRYIAETQKLCEDNLKNTNHLLRQATEINTRRGKTETLALINNYFKREYSRRKRTLPPSKSMVGFKCVQRPPLLSNNNVSTKEAAQEMARDFIGTVSV